jgi:hypothetical protein
MGASDARRKTAHRTVQHCTGARRNARATRAQACTRVRGPCDTPVKRRRYASRGRAAGGLSTHLGGGLPRENLPWVTHSTRKGASTRPRMCARTQAHAHAHKHTHIVTLTQAHIDTCAGALACAQVHWRAQLNWRAHAHAQLNWRAHAHAQVRERTSSHTTDRTTRTPARAHSHPRAQARANTHATTRADKHARTHARMHTHTYVIHTEHILTHKHAHQ